MKTFPEAEKSSKVVTKNVKVFRPDDITFTSFFKNADVKMNQENQFRLNLNDLDSIQRHSPLVQRRNIKVQKRKGPSKNPIKALAEREDIKYEYTEVLTGVAERETKRLNIEKCECSFNSKVHYAVFNLTNNIRRSCYKF